MAKSTVKHPPRPQKSRDKLVEMPPPAAPEPAAEPFEPDPDAPELPPEADQAGPEPPGISRKAFPPPPRGAKGGYCKAEEGMAYWLSLTPEFVARTNIYINREWPILDRMQELSREEQAEVIAHRRRPPFKYIDKPPNPFGPDTRMEFLQRYGSGEYKVYVNDAGVRGAKGDPDLQPHTLCKFVYSVSDSDFPPVLDPNRPDKGLGILDRKHPRNASYITDLQTRGVLPLEDGENMQPGAGNQQVVKDLADQVRGLAGQLAQGKQEEVLREVREMKTGGGIQELLLSLLLKQMQAPPQAAPPPADTNNALVSLFQGQIQTLRDELREEREQRRKYEDSIRERANQPPPDPFAHFERMIGTFDRAKEFFVKASGGGVVDATVKHVSKMSGTLEFLSDVIPKIVESPILNALAQRLAMGPATAANPAMPAAPGAPGGAGPSDRAELLRFVQQITPAMLNYFDGNTGGEFAEWIHCGYPERLAELQQQGPAVIVATYQASPLWARLMTQEPAFRKFVDDFCRWNPTATEEEPRPEGDNDGDEEGTAPIDFDAQLNQELAGAPLA